MERERERERERKKEGKKERKGLLFTCLLCETVSITDEEEE